MCYLITVPNGKIKDPILISSKFEDPAHANSYNHLVA